MGRYIKAKKPLIWIGNGLLEQIKELSKPTKMVLTKKELIEFIRKGFT